MSINDCLNMIPYQWWVEDGDNWCATSWEYVLTLKHRGQRIKLGRP